MTLASVSPEVPIPNLEHSLFVQMLCFPMRRTLYFVGIHSLTVTEDLLAPTNDFLSFRINITRWTSRYLADTEFSQTINTLYHANTGVSPSQVLRLRIRVSWGPSYHLLMWSILNLSKQHVSLTRPRQKTLSVEPSACHRFSKKCPSPITGMGPTAWFAIQVPTCPLRPQLQGLWAKLWPNYPLSWH